MKVLTVTDITRREICLTSERWKHINEEHPEIAGYIHDFEIILSKPTHLRAFGDDIAYYYRKYERRYLLLVVKYLNGKGFIITAYFVRKQ